MVNKVVSKFSCLEADTLLGMGLFGFIGIFATAALGFLPQGFGILQLRQS